MAAGRVTSQERSNLVPIATNGHGTPATAMRAGIVVEKEPAGRIGAAPDARARSLDEEFGCGAGNGGEKPLEAALACNVVKGPGTIAHNQFVVTFRDSKDFVDRINPGAREGLPIGHSGEQGSERLPQAEDAEKNSIDGEGFGGVQRAQAKRALFGDQAGVEKEGDKLVPREVVGRGRGVGKIERESTGDQRHRRTAIGSHEAASPLTNP